MTNEIGRVGFPDFWNRAYAEKPEAFDATHALIDLENKIFAKEISEPLHKVIRMLGRISGNSLSALTTMLLNGYSHDGMKIARAIFEASVTVAYLIKHPDELEDYFDFAYIVGKRRLDHEDARYPERTKTLTAEQRKQIQANYDKVVDRFKSGRAYPRHHWCKNSLFAMAKDVEMEDHYHATYGYASGMHHIDITGMIAQGQADGNDVEVAPSTTWLKGALFAGHRGMLSILKYYNDIAGHGFDKELEEAKETFAKIWIR